MRCKFNAPWAAVIIGAITGPVYLGGSAALIRLRIDDVVDAVPVHLYVRIARLVTLLT